MKTILPAALMVLAGLAALPPAQAQGKRYEPSQRTRVGGLDACMKDEVMNGAFCVKQCAPGFRMELAPRSAACVAVSADAQVPPPQQPEYTPPAKKLEAGAKGT
jgi:hypothetical protein